MCAALGGITMYRIYDLMCAPSLIKTVKTLKELRTFAREYHEKCEGNWWPVFERLANGKWVEHNYKYM